MPALPILRDIFLRNMAFKENRIIILLILLFVNICCERSNEGQDSPPPAGVEQELGKFSLTRSQKGYSRWKLEAKSADFMESGQVKIQDVKLVIFGDKNKADIRGDKGEFSQSTYNVKMTKNVKGVLSDGGRLTTDEIYWSESDKRIYTLPGTKVTIVYKGFTIMGEELEARPDLQTVSLKNITGLISR